MVSWKQGKEGGGGGEKSRSSHDPWTGDLEKGGGKSHKRGRKGSNQLFFNDHSFKAGKKGMVRTDRKQNIFGP